MKHSTDTRRRIAALAARPEFWLCCLLGWLLISAARSLGTPWGGAALTEALRWGAGIGLTLTLGAGLRRTQTAGRLAAVLAGAMALLGLADGLGKGGGGLVGPYHDHQLYGSALLLLLPFAVARTLTERTPGWRYGLLAAGGAAAACLVLSQTRSAWAGAAAASLVFAGLWNSRRTVFPRSWLRAGASGLVLASALGVLWLLLAPADLRAPLAARAGTLGALSVDESWQTRLALWHNAGGLVAAHPLLGVGLGRYPEAQWAATHAGRPLSPTERPSLSEEAHSFYLQTAAETGLIGLGLYLAALAAFMARGLGRLRRRRGSPSARDGLVIAALALVAGQAVDALASPSWQFAEVSLLGWALLGLGLAAQRGRAPEAAPAPVPWPRAGRLAAFGATAVTLAGLFLPLGVLNPVEAYTPPTVAGYTWHYIPNSAVVAGPATVAAGSMTQYTLTAKYYTNAAHTATQVVDVTSDSTSVFGSTYPSGGASASTFGTGTSRNVLTAAVSDGNPSKMLSVSGRFYDTTYGNIPAAPITVTVTAH